MSNCAQKRSPGRAGESELENEHGLKLCSQTDGGGNLLLRLQTNHQ